MIEALTLIKEQTDKFELLVDELEKQMDCDTFYDQGDLAICERILYDHKEYLASLYDKYDMIQQLIAERAN